MKKSIIYLGILATMFINASYAKAIELDQQILESEVSKSNTNLTSENNLLKPVINLESENSLMESLEIISSHYKKSIEEIIKEDKQITESKEELFQPLSIEPTIEDYIRMNNQIIDSTLSDEVYPLDFELINQSNKVSNNYDYKIYEALKS